MTRKALLVGINDYAPVGVGGPDLRGCVNDVRDMATTLVSLGVVTATPATLLILTDQRATRANILAAFKALIKGAKKGDVLIFYYSGHGSYVVDVSGDELDKKDETICPHDYATAGMIKDDDFRALLAGLPAGVNLDVFFDSCHAGTGTRELAALAATPELDSIAYRYVEPPIDWAFFAEAEPELETRAILSPVDPAIPNAARTSVEVPGLNHVLWAACRDAQTSAEALIGGTYRGVYTYALCKTLKGTGLSITRRKLDALVCMNVKSLGFSQGPQVEGAKVSLDEKVFT